MKLKKFFALLLITFFALPVVAQAADIPLLTWERGRTQQVVLGGGEYINNWEVKLEGNGVTPLLFSASQPNTAGYIIYTLDIPNDLPTGAYTISTEGTRSPRTVVAGVELIPAQTVTVTDSLFDLTKIIAIFVFLTIVISSLRASKYSRINFASSQVQAYGDLDILDHKSGFVERLVHTPYRLRISGINSLNNSLFRFMLIREGELAHRISKDLYAALPILGFIAGGIAAVETFRNNGIATTPLTIFIAIAIISIFDAYSGILATIAFWALQTLTGNVTSFRDALIMLAIGIAWVAPSLFAGVLRDTISRDFSARVTDDRDPLKFVGVFASALIGSTLFYFGHALINSVIYTQSAVREISITDIAIVAAILLIRGFLDLLNIGSSQLDQVREESFYIARASSPKTALILSFVVFGFVYVWTNAAGSSAVVALIFTLPYYLVFMGFRESQRFRLKLPPRNVLIESALGVGLVFIIFRQISLTPLLGDQRSDLLLLLAGIPGLAHAVYGAICSTAEKQEIIKL